MGDTASNEAKIVISTDPAQFVKFMTDAARAFRDLEKEGKQSTGKIRDQFGGLRNSIVEGFKDAGGKLLANTMTPYQVSLQQMTQDARRWRQENTRLMGATDQGWYQIGQQIDEAAKKTRRLPQEVSNYSSAVAQLTGSWDSAQDGIKDYSALSRYLGRQTVEELSPLAATMENLFGVKGANRARDFFNQAIAGAQQLGQSGRLSLSAFEKIAPAAGLHAPKDPKKREQYLREFAILGPTFQKVLEYAPEQAERGVAETLEQILRKGTYFEQQARGAGLLKKGEHIRIGGRLTKTPLEILELIGGVARHHQEGRGRGTEGIRWQRFLENNVNPWLQEVFLDKKIEKEFFSTARAATRAVPSKDYLGEIEDSYNKSQEGRRTLWDIINGIASRKTGADLLSVQDRVTVSGDDLSDEAKRKRAEEISRASQIGGALFGPTGALVAEQAANLGYGYKSAANSLIKGDAKGAAESLGEAGRHSPAGWIAQKIQGVELPGERILRGAANGLIQALQNITFKVELVGQRGNGSAGTSLTPQLAGGGNQNQ